MPAKKKQPKSVTKSATKSDNLCTVDGCNRGSHCRGLCHTHYETLCRAIRNSKGSLTWEMAEAAGACAKGATKGGKALVRHFPMLAGLLAGKKGTGKTAANTPSPTTSIAPPATDVLPIRGRAARCASCAN